MNTNKEIRCPFPTIVYPNESQDGQKQTDSVFQFFRLLYNLRKRHLLKHLSMSNRWFIKADEMLNDRNQFGFMLIHHLKYIGTFQG